VILIPLPPEKLGLHVCITRPDLVPYKNFFFKQVCTHCLNTLPEHLFHMHTYLYVHRLLAQRHVHTFSYILHTNTHTTLCTHTTTYAHAIVHTFLFAWVAQWLQTPMDGSLARPEGSTWEEVIEVLWDVVSPATFPLFIFLNVLSACYHHVFSLCNDSIAHSCFLHRSKEPSGPYILLLEPIISAF
jgi:hypothetical protein